MNKTPMDILFEKAEMKCTICKEPAGACDCWVKCPCGWLYERGENCNNPKHKEQKDKWIG